MEISREDFFATNNLRDTLIEFAKRKEKTKKRKNTIIIEKEHTTSKEKTKKVRGNAIHVSIKELQIKSNEQTYYFHEMLPPIPSDKIDYEKVQLPGFVNFLLKSFDLDLEQIYKCEEIDIRDAKLKLMFFFVNLYFDHANFSNPTQKPGFFRTKAPKELTLAFKGIMEKFEPQYSNIDKAAKRLNNIFKNLRKTTIKEIQKHETETYFENKRWNELGWDEYKTIFENQMKVFIKILYERLIKYQEDYHN